MLFIKNNMVATSQKLKFTPFVFNSTTKITDNLAEQLIGVHFDLIVVTPKKQHMVRKRIKYLRKADNIPMEILSWSFTIPLPP